MMQLAEMTADDYDAVLALWQRSEGVGLTVSDTREAVAAFLARNPGQSWVARHHHRVVGAVLCGHDGRRGYLYHLAVDEAFRGQGIGRALVATCQSRLAQLGILKTSIFVYRSNDAGQQIWRRLGWKDRPDLMVLQQETNTAAKQPSASKGTA